MESDPIAISALLLLAASPLTRYLRKPHPRGYFLAQVAVFSALTWLLREDHIIPYIVNPYSGTLPGRVLVEGLEIAWWLAAAWLTRAFLRAFVVLGKKEREAILIQELLGAVVYLSAVVAIFTYVLDLPVRGLLATSGALAIIIGLALQSSLGDAFSGLVMNLERPYRVGDWIIMDATVQGHVIETNWRATHIRTTSNDLAIVPNSIIAKSKIVNCSEPGYLHSASVSVRLNRALSPDVASELLKDVLIGSAQDARLQNPAVTITDITAETIEFKLGFAVPDITSVDKLKAEVLRRAFYAIGIAGAGFASANPDPGDSSPRALSGLLEAVPLFATLTPEERQTVLKQKVRRVYRAGAVVARGGDVLQSLVIVNRGVLVSWEDDGSRSLESSRLSPGLHVGEMGLLTGEPLGGEITALIQTVTFEISKAALTPILSARPAFADELGETLECQLEARRSALSHWQPDAVSRESMSARIADTIRHLFSLHAK